MLFRIVFAAIRFSSNASRSKMRVVSISSMDERRGYVLHRQCHRIARRLRWNWSEGDRRWRLSRRVKLDRISQPPFIANENRTKEENGDSLISSALVKRRVLDRIRSILSKTLMRRSIKERERVNVPSERWRTTSLCKVDVDSTVFTR